jgi:cell division GTPase FtsZ
MENKLAEALVKKGVLPAGTEVHAKHFAKGLCSVNTVLVSNDFSIIGTTIREDGKVVFRLADLRSGKPTDVLAEAVETIDGMDPVRFADVYNVTADGGKAILGKRRGRKPKNRRPEEDEDDEF